jgi:hypothetical protein
MGYSDAQGFGWLQALFERFGELLRIVQATGESDGISWGMGRFPGHRTHGLSRLCNPGPRLGRTKVLRHVALSRLIYKVSSNCGSQLASGQSRLYVYGPGVNGPGPVRRPGVNGPTVVSERECQAWRQGPVVHPRPARFWVLTNAFFQPAISKKPCPSCEGSPSTCIGGLIQELRLCDSISPTTSPHAASHFIFQRTRPAVELLGLS